MKKLWLLCACLVLAGAAACGQKAAPAARAEKDFTLQDWLCLYTPGNCNSKAIKEMYLAAPDKTIEVTLNGGRLRIPVAYLRPEIMAGVGATLPADSTVYLTALAPDMAPRTPRNLKYSFYPHSYNQVEFSLMAGQSTIAAWNSYMHDVAHGSDSITRPPIHRADRYGLEIWGENFATWPRQAPCPYPKTSNAPCGDLTPNDSLHPIQPNGPLSAMTCAPVMQVDMATHMMSLSDAEREKFQAALNQDPDRPLYPQCTHYMLYQPLNLWVTIRYRSGLLPQWKQTEDRIRAVLDSFIVR